MINNVVYMSLLCKSFLYICIDILSYLKQYFQRKWKDQKYTSGCISLLDKFKPLLTYNR